MRNFGMYSPSEYVGLSLDEAKKYAEEGGFITRVVETDGRGEMVDLLDVKSNRLNFRIRGGYVIDVWGG